MLTNCVCLDFYRDARLEIFIESLNFLNLKKTVDKSNKRWYNILVEIEVWLSLVERYVRDVEVASSNLVTSTSGKLPPPIIGDVRQ